jgi:hypothetical protein
MPSGTAMMQVAEALLAERRTTSSGESPKDTQNRRGGNVFVVDFHRDGNSAAHRTFGWSGQEQGHVWSLEESSGLRLPSQGGNTPLTVELDFTIPTGRIGLNTAVIRVFANGYPIGAAAVTGWTRLRCDIPDGLIAADEAIDLRFEHPCFAQPEFLDLGHEDRLLGICFYAVRIYPPWMKPSLEHFAPKPPEGKTVQAVVQFAGPVGEPNPPAVYRFGAGDADRAMLRDGWQHDPQSDAWASGRISTLEVPAPAVEGQYLARFTISPLYIRSIMTTQRITILLSGAVIGQYRTGTPVSLAIPLPPELFEVGGVLPFTFVVPDGLPMHRFDPAQPPSFLSFLLESIEITPLPSSHAALARVRDDDLASAVPIAVSERFLDEPADELPDAVKAALGIEMAEILRNYESLGDNCAFGLAQRKGGCEVLGLLRFANTPLRSLMIALDDEFKAAADKAELTLRLPDGQHGEYCLFADRYGIRWHTNVFGGDAADENAIFAQQAMRLGYLRRKFYEALHAGRKIITISRGEPRKHPIPLPFAAEPELWEEKPERLRLAEILPLFLKLNESGANTLLFLTRCERNKRSGAVELIAPGVMRGYMDDFVIRPELDSRDHAAWLRVVINAWLLDQGPNAAFRNKAT